MLAFIWFFFLPCSRVTAKFMAVQSDTSHYDCSFGGISVCCSILNKTYGRPTAVRTKPVSDTLKVEQENSGTSENAHIETITSGLCNYTKEYVPSAYEKAHLAKAKQIVTITDFEIRRKAYVQFITSQEEVTSSKRWLSRVRKRMLSGTQQTTEDDLRFLSRFRVTRFCRSEKPVIWREWIEPLSVHGRHPFSLSQCNPREFARLHSQYGFSSNYSAYAVDLLNVDYILTRTDPIGRRNISSVLINSDERYQNLLFDAGSDMFRSSTLWLNCAYAQNDIVFDSIFTWELNVIKPSDYWSEVPPHIASRLHFYNVAVSKNMSDPHSPLRIIRDIAVVDDFVAFKLDIDYPTVEIPIVLDIVTDHSISQLIDEFFFELHFQCEIMAVGCWGHTPDVIAGQKLDRYSAMLLFYNLRQRGVRAHFWP